MALGDSLLGGGFQSPIGDFSAFQERVNRSQDIDQERYNREHLGIPVTVSDELKVEEMHKKNLQLQKKIDDLAFEKDILEVENKDKTKRYEELLEENRWLKAEVEKIHSRFSILDL